MWNDKPNMWCIMMPWVWAPLLVLALGIYLAIEGALPVGMMFNGFGCIIILTGIMAQNKISYFLENNNLCIKTGLLGSKVQKIRTVDIRNIVIEQSPLERIFQVQTITVTTSSADLPLRVQAIASASELEALLNAGR